MSFKTKKEFIEEFKKEGLLLSNGKFNPSYAKKFKNSINSERKEWFDSVIGESLSEKIYCIVHGIDEKPVCIECGNPVNFISYTEGYRQFCCSQCRAIGNKEKVAQTNILKYGTKAPAQNKDVYRKIEETTEKNFGVKNIFERTDIIQQAIYDKYGVSHIMKVEGIQEKIIKTNNDRYGVDFSTQNKKVIDKRNRTNILKYGNICSIHGEIPFLKTQEVKKRKYWEHIIASRKFKEKVEPLFSFEDYIGNVSKTKNIENIILGILSVLKKEIELNLLTSKGTIDSNKVRSSKNKDLIEQINEFIVEDISLREKIWLIRNGFLSSPKCYCGNSVKFVNTEIGYSKCCSAKCSSNKEETKQKKVYTTIERYGVEHALQNKEIQNRIKATNNEKYGCDYGFQSEVIKDKIKLKNLENYGVDNPLKNPEIAYKVRQSKLNKFWEHILNSNRLKNLIEPLFNKEEYEGGYTKEVNVIYYSWKCKKCNSEFRDYIANGKIPRCPTCYPSTAQGESEKELAEWIKTILPTEEVIIGNREVLRPYEIDIYIPKHNIAIEFNEIYWHSELTTNGKRGKSYHLYKTNKCKEQNIQLIHIFDSEWFNTPDIVKSIICSKLGIFSEKYHARKCEVRKITSEESRLFLDDNHIQGYASSSIRYGLFYNNELISHLALGKNRFRAKTYEVVRYVNKKNSLVNGGLSKLWKYAKMELPKEFELISYVDIRWFQGESNTKLGLSLEKENSPGFYYTKDHKVLFNRMSFQKHMLKDKLEIFDETLTEWENMQLNGYDRIWDCGTAVYSGIFENNKPSN